MPGTFPPLLTRGFGLTVLSDPVPTISHPSFPHSGRVQNFVMSESEAGGGEQGESLLVVLSACVRQNSHC